MLWKSLSLFQTFVRKPYLPTRKERASLSERERRERERDRERVTEGGVFSRARDSEAKKKKREEERRVCCRYHY